MNLCSLEMEINVHMVAFKGFGRRIIYKYVYLCVCVQVCVRVYMHESFHCVYLCVFVPVCESGLLCAYFMHRD